MSKFKIVLAIFNLFVVLFLFLATVTLPKWAVSTGKGFMAGRTEIFTGPYSYAYRSGSKYEKFKLYDYEDKYVTFICLNSCINFRLGNVITTVFLAVAGASLLIAISLLFLALFNEKIRLFSALMTGAACLANSIADIVYFTESYEHLNPVLQNKLQFCFFLSVLVSVYMLICALFIYSMKIENHEI